MKIAPPSLESLLDSGTPILQAPMAGVSTARLAAAVSEAGGLGGIAVGAMTPERAAAVLAEVADLTARPVNVNVFVHEPPRRDGAREAAWIARLAPLLEALDAPVPARLDDPYRSFLDDDRMLQVLLEARVRVVSFHFGVPRPHQVEALHAAGVLLLATATSVDEARTLEAAGIDVIVAQGTEAGGHRGVHDPDRDPGLGIDELVRESSEAVDLPLVAAGGLMTGSDIARVLDLGASAVQLGTAFVACPEGSASARHRRLLAEAEGVTAMTRLISGRPARGLVRAWQEALGEEDAVPDYPVAYDGGKALAKASVERGDGAFEVLWAGTGAGRARDLPAGELVALLGRELAAASREKR
ncbi:MAG: nitronate monooxygenase [Gammaproteobacteria bacterium]|nr:nitronate monooxygenase [Gammaproteobacteria bacterium]